MTDLPVQLPHGPLEEVLADIFFVTGQTKPVFGGRPLQFSRNMTILRSGSDLTLVNTLRLDEAGLARLDSLGTVRHVVKLGAFHGRDDAFYQRRYGATVWAFPGMPHERGVITDAELIPGQPGPIPEASAFRYNSSSFPEGHLLVHQHGGVLLACDALQNMTRPDAWFDEGTARLMAAQGFFRSANIGPGWLNTAKPSVTDFQRLLALPFQHLLSAHGPPLLHDAHQAVRATVQAVFGR